MDKPLIVGAGPVGLAAAVFLLRRGISARVIDVLEEPSPYSKALAINPRTLEIMEHIGLADKIIGAGKKIQEMNICRQGKKPIRLKMDRLHNKYNFMLALSQASTEEILHEELRRLGGNVERGMRLNHCKANYEFIDAEIENVTTGAIEKLKPQFMLGADGSRSMVREELGISFEGSSMDNKWYLADVALDTELADDRGYVYFLKRGFIFMLRVIDHKREDNLWRIISNLENPLQHLQDAKPAAAPVWQSSFHIGHRLASRFDNLNIYLAGDAAHIHSPLGARGMNLGIEDAWQFAELMAAGKADLYAATRREIDGKVVKRVKTMTYIVSGETAFASAVRNNIVPVLAGMPVLVQKMLRVGTGLDHELDF